MKSFHQILTAVLATLFLHEAHALTLPVSEDTSASVSGVLTTPFGRAGMLRVAPRRVAFLRFEAGAFAGSIAGQDVIRARLVFYLPQVVERGDLTLHRVAGEWTESVAASVPGPPFDPAVIATIPQGAVIARQFVIVDVTAQVKSWLAAPATDFGFAVASSGVVSPNASALSATLM